MSTNVGSIHYELDLKTDKFDSNSSKVSSKLGSVGGGLVTLGTKVAKYGTLAAGVVAGLAIKGGFDRALNIEDAKAKLKGLGHDTKGVETIMGSALASVKGTAYGLDSAATAAASAVAAGVKPGQDLTRVLKLTGDTAQITGRSFGEAGAVINKVLASNKLSMEEVNQLQDAGLPILSMLGKEYGKTAGEMREMVSKGEVDSARFLNAIENNIGGAALESGNTVRGAFANMKAAISRTGAALVEKWLPKIKDALVGITGWVDDNKDKILLWVDRIVGFFGEVGKVIVAAIPYVVTAFKMLFEAGKVVWEIFKQVWNIIATWFLPSLSALWNAIVTQLLPAFGELWTSVVRLWNSLNPALMTALKVVGAILGIAFVAIIWIVINVLNVVIKVFGWLADAIALVIGWISNIINWIGNYYALWINVWKGAWALMQWFRDNWQQVVAFIINWGLKIVAWFLNLHLTILKTIGGAISWLVQKGKDIIQGLINGIKAMGGALWNGIKSVADKVGQFFAGAGRWFWDAGASLIRGLTDGIKSMANAPVDAVKGIVNKVKGWLPGSPAEVGPFSGKGYSLYRGQALMKDFATGISNMATLPQEAIANAMNNVGSPQNTSNTSIYGNINIGSQSDADDFFKRLGRNQELSSKGLSSLVGTV